MGKPTGLLLTIRNLTFLPGIGGRTGWEGRLARYHGDCLKSPSGCSETEARTLLKEWRARLLALDRMAGTKVSWDQARFRRRNFS
jgi:hypothetical protein